MRNVISLLMLLLLLLLCWCAASVVADPPITWPSNVESCCKPTMDCGVYISSCSTGQLDCGLFCCRDINAATAPGFYGPNNYCPVPTSVGHYAGTQTSGRIKTQTPCPKGRWGNVKSKASVDDGCPGKCAAGTHGTGSPGATNAPGAACVTCDTGKISAAGSAACNPCDAGTKTIDHINCVDCAAGTFSASGSASCTQCGAGSWSAVKSSGCTLCSPGTSSTALGATSSGTCSPCARGTWASSSGSTSCSGACGAGQYANVGTGHPSEAAACSPCGVGTYNHFTTIRLSCLTCSAGTASSATGATSSSTCGTCSAGSWSAAGASSCTLCLPGTANSNTGSTTVDACVSCPTSRWSSSSGAATCSGSCPAGYVGKAGTGHTSQSSACSLCAVGNSCAGGSAPSVPCPAGSWCPSGSSSPQGCPRGKFCLKGTTDPQPCPVGRFSNSSSLAAADECTACTAGKACTTSGLTAPDAECSAGFYCPPAQSVPNPESYRCPRLFHCPAGSAAPLACGPTTFQPLPAMPQCDACPMGFFCVGNATDKQQCPSGNYCPTSSSEPWPCRKSTFNAAPGGIGPRDCFRCSPGFFCNGTALSQPTGKCSAGYFCTGGTTTPTPRGKVGGDRCPAGSYCPEQSPEPTPCPAGTFSNSVGLAAEGECSTCTAGKACTTSGLTAPDAECSAGFYCPAGQTSATPSNFSCPRGHYCLAGTRNGANYPCPPGTANNHTQQTSSSSCVECAEQTFQPGSGKALCLPCPARTITEARNRSSCVPVERTETPVVREETELPTTPPSRVNAQPAGVKTMLDLTSIIGVLSGASAAGVAQSRLQNAMQLAACGTGEYLTKELDFMSSPIAIEIGSQPLAFHRGAVIVHFLCVIFAAGLFYFIAFAYYLWRRPLWRVATQRTRLPGLLYVPLSIIIGGASEAAAALIWHGSQPLDYALGALDVVFLVVAPTGWMLWVMYRSGDMCILKLKPYLEKELQNDEAAASAAAADVGLLDLERSLALDLGDSNGNDGERQRGPNKDHCFARNCPTVYRGYRWVAVNHSEWLDVEPVYTEVDAEGSKESLDEEVLKHGMVYEDYNNAKFGPAEAVVTAVMGCTAGIGAGVLSRPACLMWLFVATVFIVIHVSALIMFRPLLNRGLATFVTLSTLVTAITTLLALLQFLGEAIDYPTTYLSLSTIQSVISMCATFLNFAAAGAIMMNFYSAFQRGHQGRGQQAAVSQHANFDDWLELIDASMIDGGHEQQQQQQQQGDNESIDLTGFLSADADDLPEIDLGGDDDDDVALVLENKEDDDDERKLEENLADLLLEQEVSPKAVELELPAAPPEPVPAKQSSDYQLDDGEEGGDGNDAAGAGDVQFDENGNRIGKVQIANAAQLRELQAALGRGDNAAAAANPKQRVSGKSVKR